MKLNFNIFIEIIYCFLNIVYLKKDYIYYSIFQMSSTNENIDKLAQSFFLVLIFCSLLSDSYIIFENFIKNDYVKKK